MEIGNFVTIKKDSKKIIYKIIDKKEDNYIIVGVNYRIWKKVLEEDISIASNDEVNNENNLTTSYHDKIIKNNSLRAKKHILGTILHLDGDSEYLNKCLELYKTLGIYAYGVSTIEKEMKSKIETILKKINPDIIVITGHDAYNNKGAKDLNNYINSKNFMEAVLTAKLIKNDAIIIAGACQSNFEALIASGANFASSPKRINVHTFDPAVIAIKAATTSLTRLINFDDVIKYIDDERNAFWGIETFGKMRMFV